MSFRLKIVLGIALIQACLLFVLIYSSLDFLRASNERELEKRAVTAVRLFATSIKEAVLSTNLASLESSVAEAMTNPDIDYVRVLDNRGVLAQAGNPPALARTFRADTKLDSVSDGIFDVADSIEVLGVAYGRVEIGFSVAAIDAVLREARLQALTIAVAAIALVALASFILGLYLTRGLDVLIRGTRRLSAGELGHQITVRGNDEFAAAARAFNHMSCALLAAATAQRRHEAELAASRDNLEQTVQQRTHELRAAQAELVTAARQAGMAEVATNVLHNVGNVLNSVNVSAGVLGGQVRNSKAAGLARVVQMLDEHSADLGDFLSRDEKGRRLPDYLGKLATALAAEQQSLLDEIGQLSKSVEHIKDIVATQQAYAGASRMIEPLRIRDLVDDALRMNAGSLVRHDVTVVKEIADLPPLPLDRHRLLQILVNLISNAKQAMDVVSAPTHRLTLRADLVDGAENRCLRISVADEGEGIAAENLTRIFSHGFTTRRDGHGFGLHSCALAATEMGGSLSAHSDGPGRGACFSLELPVAAPGGAA